MYTDQMLEKIVKIIYLNQPWASTALFPRREASSLPSDEIISSTLETSLSRNSSGVESPVSFTAVSK